MLRKLRYKLLLLLAGRDFTVIDLRNKALINTGPARLKLSAATTLQDLKERPQNA